MCKVFTIYFINLEDKTIRRKEINFHLLLQLISVYRPMVYLISEGHALEFNSSTDRQIHVIPLYNQHQPGTKG